MVAEGADSAKELEKTMLAEDSKQAELLEETFVGDGVKVNEAEKEHNEEIVENTDNLEEIDLQLPTVKCAPNTRDITFHRRPQGDFGFSLIKTKVTRGSIF